MPERARENHEEEANGEDLINVISVVVAGWAMKRARESGKRTKERAMIVFRPAVIAAAEGEAGSDFKSYC